MDYEENLSTARQDIEYLLKALKASEGGMMLLDSALAKVEAIRQRWSL